MRKGFLWKIPSARGYSRHSVGGRRGATASWCCCSLRNESGCSFQSSFSQQSRRPFIRGFAEGSIRPPPESSVKVAKTLSEAFRTATLYSDDRTYRLLRVPISSMDIALGLWESSTRFSPSSTALPPFGCFMVDKDEITLLVPADVYEEYCQNNTNDGELSRSALTDNGIGYRLFTFDDVVFDPSLVGFMAIITKALAEGNISVLPYAAYSTDHVFVAEADADRARTILEGLSESGKNKP